MDQRESQPYGKHTASRRPVICSLEFALIYCPNQTTVEKNQVAHRLIPRALSCAFFNAQGTWRRVPLQSTTRLRVHTLLIQKTVRITKLQIVFISIS